MLIIKLVGLIVCSFTAYKIGHSYGDLNGQDKQYEIFKKVVDRVKEDRAKYGN